MNIRAHNNIYSEWYILHTSLFLSLARAQPKIHWFFLSDTFLSKYVYYSHDWLLECKNVWNLKTILLGAVNNQKKAMTFLHINCMPNSLSNTHFLPYRLRAIIRFECIRTRSSYSERASVYISHCIYKLYTLRTQASVCQCIRVTFDGRWLCVGSIFWCSVVHILHTKHLSSGFGKFICLFPGIFFFWTTFKKL